MSTLLILTATLALQGGWKTYTVGPGLKIDLPSAPRQESDSRGKLEFWSLSDASGYDLVITYLGLPKGSQKARNAKLGELIDKIVQDDHVLTQTEFVQSGWPGVQLSITDGPGSMKYMRVFMTSERMLGVILRGENAKGASRRVFGSIKLPAREGKGPYASAGPYWSKAEIPGTPLYAEFPCESYREVSPRQFVPNFKTQNVSARYINQMFTVSTLPLTVPEKARDQTMRRFAAETARTFSSSAPAPKRVRIGGRDVWHITIKTDNERMASRIETFAIGDVGVRLITIGPAKLADSPVSARFFRSVKVVI